MKRRKGYYSISVVAKMFSVHQQTIRMYEKEGLIIPKRSSGNTRLFSEEDVDRLEEIINLTHKMGVNLAGVEIILKLQKKMKKMQSEINNLFGQAHGQLEAQSKEYEEDAKKKVERLIQIKEENVAKVKNKAKQAKTVDVVSENSSQEKSKDGIVSLEDWEIDYDEE